MEKGFEKAASDNLPIVDSEMVNDFYVSNLNFFSAEVKNVKTKRSAKQSYGDNAVGYVQLKREGAICCVKGKITPEHKIHNKAYKVEVLIDESDEKVLSCECNDCAASEDGCKHGVAFLLWLHRRSEEPAPTSTDCYWKKSLLSEIKNAKMDLQSLVDKQIPALGPRNDSYPQELLSKLPNNIGGIFDLYRPIKYKDLLLHQLWLQYTEVKLQDRNADDFINFLKSCMTEYMCKEAEKNTRSQSESNDWYELRFGRITASNIYEAAKCRVLDGTLTESIMGASKVPQTVAICRGKCLENSVRKEVSMKRNISIENAGLFLCQQFPIFGASPDGVSETYCIEIKCPSKEKTVENYVRNGEINKKYLCQLQLQMFFCRREKGLFCVASPNFETNKEVQIFDVTFNKNQCLDIMMKATKFWKTAIYPALSKM